MKEKNKYNYETIHNLEEKSKSTHLPFLNQDFEEIAAQFTNFLIFLACTDNNESLCKNSETSLP